MACRVSMRSSALLAALCLTALCAPSVAQAPAASGAVAAQSASPERLIFTSVREGAMQLFAVDASGESKLSRTTHPELQATWSRQGQVAFVSYRSGAGDIYTMAADGSAVVRVTRDDGLDHSPDWSPDGQRIAYVGERDTQMGLYMINADGSGQRRLAVPSAEIGAPHWSPNGTQIVYTAMLEGRSQIMLMDLGTGESRQLTFGAAGGTGPVWAPDGQSIVYVHSGSRTEGVGLRRLLLGTPEPVVLTRNGYTNSQPQFSPDGSKLLYLSNASNEGAFMNVHVMNVDGTGIVNLTRWPHVDMSATWSPDGQHIYFMSFRDWPGQIYRMKADGQDVQRLTQSKFQDGFPVVRPARQAPRTLAHGK